MAASCLYASERASASRSGPGRGGEELRSIAVGGAVFEREGAKGGGEEGGVLSARVNMAAATRRSDMYVIYVRE